MINVKGVLKTLAEERAVFHNEADFQHALAWKIHETNPSCSVRLEFRAPCVAERIYLDIWARDADAAVAIELKYKTRALQSEHRGEHFDLADQRAQDIGRYDFLKDLQRLEKVVPTQNNAVGYAILLTNDRTYWTLTRKTNAVDAAFRIDDGREIPRGQLAWSSDASDGTKRGREDPITVKGHYKLRWVDYSNPGGSSTYGKFRYLLVQVQPGNSVFPGRSVAN